MIMYIIYDYFLAAVKIFFLSWILAFDMMLYDIDYIYSAWGLLDFCKLNFLK